VVELADQGSDGVEVVGGLGAGDAGGHGRLLGGVGDQAAGLRAISVKKGRKP